MNSAPANSPDDQPAIQPADDASEFGELLKRPAAVGIDRKIGQFVVNDIDELWRVAKMYSRTLWVPRDFRGKPDDIMAAYLAAMRLKVDPLGFMQCCYVVHGKVGIEAKVAIALANLSGVWSSPIEFKFSGTRGKDDWACTAYATDAKSGKVLTQKVDWAMVKAEGWFDKDGSKWKSMPEIMFQYRSAMFLNRIFHPEILYGLATVDELIDAGPDRDAASPGAPLTPNEQRRLLGLGVPAEKEAEATEDPPEERNGKAEETPAVPVANDPQPEPEPETANAPAENAELDGFLDAIHASSRVDDAKDIYRQAMKSETLDKQAKDEVYRAFVERKKAGINSGQGSLI